MSESIEDAEVYATIPEVAEMAGCHEKTIRRYIRRGWIRPKPGHTTELGRPKRKRRRCWLLSPRHLVMIENLLRKGRG